MIYNTKKFTILSFLFAFVTLTSCIDDDLLPCVDNKNGEVEGYTDGYAINLTVTLDKMGGRRAQTVGQLEDIENYIDPEKFRILFFDHNDKFLFESKSRWVKQLSPSGNGAEWLISVPMYTIGNDEEYNWEWDSIRTALTTNNFKIAILANRPGVDFCTQLDDTGLEATTYDNTGPHWGREQTSWYAREYNKEKSEGDQIKPKDVFDLHHSQFDPIYTGKNWYAKSPTHIKHINGENGFYEFIAEKKGTEFTSNSSAGNIQLDSLYMSSTSSWVYWSETEGREDVDNRGKFGLRYFVPPTKDHPIPMYGIQQFKPITNWIKGTPFNLSNLTGNQPDDIYDFRSISLLRSVVKLELVIPKSDDYTVEYVLMFFPNIYARCEPMDVWTPTDSLWKDEHHTDDCHDWYSIKKYGPVTRNTDAAYPNQNIVTDLKNYYKRMSWFYGAWKDKGWDFNGLLGEAEIGADALFPEINDSSHYPRIFNSCIQRNSTVYCGEELNFGDSKNHHYVVYTGERNINDPARLNQLGRSTTGNPTVQYWAFVINNNVTKKRTLYRVPLTSYDNVSNINEIIKIEELTADQYKDTAPGTDMNNYEKKVQDPDDTTPKPWPLIRNHVYRITIKGPAELDGEQTWNFRNIASSLSQVRMDENWKPNEKSETKVLSWSEASISNNVAKWNDGSTIMIMNSDKKHSNGDDITINGTKRKTIKVSNGAQNKLELGDNKVTRRISLYSYVSNSAIDYPTNNNYSNNIAIVQGGTATINKDNINFANSGTNNGVILTIENRGFKKGDRIEITGKISDGKKRGCVEIYAKINGEYTLVDKTNDFSTTASKEIHILAQDAEDLCLARNGNTGTQITLLKVFRNSYWKEINGDIAANGFKAFSSSDTPDKHIYPLINKNNTYTTTTTNSVTFTNTGEQVGYVMFVDAEENNNKNLWRFENPNGELKANGQAIEALKDLKFSGSSIYLYEPDTQNDNKTKIRLLGDKSTITFPNLKEGSTITIVGQSANHDVAERGIKPVQDYLVFDSENSDPQLNGQCIFVGKKMSGAVNDGVYTFKWTVKDCGSDDFVPVQFELIKGGIDFYEFHIETPSTTNRAAISDDSGNNKPNIRIKSEKLYSKNI